MIVKPVFLGPRKMKLMIINMMLKTKIKVAGSRPSVVFNIVAKPEVPPITRSLWSKNIL